MVLFDQDELEAWLKQGRICHQSDVPLGNYQPIEWHPVTEPMTEVGAGVVEISSPRVYHRIARYR